MLKASNVARLVLRHNSTNKNAFSKEVLLSEANKVSCIEKMQAGMPKMSRGKGPPKNAAVLIPLIVSKDKNEVSLLFTLRSSNLKKHTGQVSFPGGIRDTDDVSFTECALRETEEEIGIKRDQITIWGETKLCYPTKGPGIMPVVGCIENYDPALLRINTLEVARVFTIPISLLCSNKQHTQFKSNYSLPVFTCPGTVERVWGITAVITDVFLRSLVSSDIYDNRIKFISKYTCIR